MTIHLLRGPRAGLLSLESKLLSEAAHFVAAPSRKSDIPQGSEGTGHKWRFWMWFAVLALAMLWLGGGRSGRLPFARSPAAHSDRTASGEREALRMRWFASPRPGPPGGSPERRREGGSSQKVSAP